LLAVFLVARLIVVACAVGVEQLAPPNPAGPAGSALQYTHRPLLASLTSWDGIYYLGIAADGYRAGPVNGPYPNIVFFPLYPLAVRAVAAPLGGDVPLAGVLVANAAGLAALFVAYALARRRLGADAALLAATFVALQPGAVAFAMAYSDSLFLLLAITALLCAERDQRPAAGILAALAGLTRLQGALLIVPLLLLFASRDGRKPRLSWLWALGGPLGLAAFGAFIGGMNADPFALLTAQSIWDTGVPGAVAPASALAVGIIVNVAVLLVEARLLLDRWRGHSDAAGSGWALANVAAIVAARRIASLLRYLAPVTQLAEQLASGTYRRRVVSLALAGAVAGYAALAVLHFALLLAP
jgi:4-amino-4-deoxy-L-arabinose transferase-like glycosyltransferase